MHATAMSELFASKESPAATFVYSVAASVSEWKLAHANRPLAHARGHEKSSNGALWDF